MILKANSVIHIDIFHSREEMDTPSGTKCYFSVTLICKQMEEEEVLGSEHPGWKYKQRRWLG